jgi:hypothetical protein
LSPSVFHQQQQNELKERSIEGCCQAPQIPPYF